MTIHDAPKLRLRLWCTALLVLIALGSAGLAVGADQQQNPIQRPELTFRADRAARPWIQELARELATVDHSMVELSGHGRQALSYLQAGDLDGMRAELAAGDEISTEFAVPLEPVSTLRTRAVDAIDTSRLGPSTRGALEQLSNATDAAQQVPVVWHTVATEEGTIANLAPSLTEALLGIEAAHTAVVDALAAAAALDTTIPTEPTPST